MGTRRVFFYDYLIFRQDADEAVKGAAWFTSIALGLSFSLPAVRPAVEAAHASVVT